MFIEVHELLTSSATREMLSISLFAEISRGNRVAINISPLCGDNSAHTLQDPIEIPSRQGLIKNRRPAVALQITALILFVSVLGCACKQQSAANHWQEAEKESIRRGNEARSKYRSGDYQAAKSALLDLLQFLDKVSYPPNAPNEFREDAMLTCLRLAKLEERQGHDAEKATYMKQAVTRCESFPLKGKCDEDNLRELIDRLDALPK